MIPKCMMMVNNKKKMVTEYPICLKSIILGPLVHLDPKTLVMSCPTRPSSLMIALRLGVRSELQ